MTEDLTRQQCVACTADAEPVKEYEIPELKTQIPQWDVLSENGEQHLQRTYPFPDFKSALDFTRRIGDLAESEGHHPALLTEYGKATVTWWTHAISGLHKNDFIMAAKTDEIASEFPVKA